jgi:hypothetical protein
VKRVQRHTVDLEFCKQIFSEACRDVASSLAWACRVSRNIAFLISNVLRAVGEGSVVTNRSPDLVRYLRLAAQAHAAHFAATGTLPVTVPLGEGEPVTYASAPDESTVHVYTWIEGFFLAALCRDGASLDLLCRAPVEPMRRSSTRNPEYRYVFREALRAFWCRDIDPGALAVQAMHLTDPDRDDIYSREYTLYIDVHLIRLFFFVHAKDADFGDGLVLALRDHKTYWSKKGRSHLPDGFLALHLLGLAALAYDRGIPFEVESEYLPMWLVTGEAFK